MLKCEKCSSDMQYDNKVRPICVGTYRKYLYRCTKCTFVKRISNPNGIVI